MALPPVPVFGQPRPRPLLTLPTGRGTPLFLRSRSTVALLTLHRSLSTLSAREILQRRIDACENSRVCAARRMDACGTACVA